MQIRGLVDWVGGGRALTQTGRLRRADALMLVELLDTGDVLDSRFPIQSSADLYRLALLVEWARACGLVRVVRGRMVPVGKRAGLLERPLDLRRSPAGSGTGACRRAWSFGRRGRCGPYRRGAGR